MSEQHGMTSDLEARREIEPRRARATRLALAPLGLALALFAQPTHASDGHIEINQVKALAGGVTPGDAPGFPVTLSVAGSYLLTSDLEVGSGAITGIEITHSSVTLDLGGFTLGVCIDNPVCIMFPGGDGIVSTAHSTTIRNGRVAGFGARGISLDERSKVIGVLVDRIGTDGIYAGDDSIVRDCQVLHTGDEGIHIEGRGSVLENNVRHAGDIGIRVSGSGGGGLIRGNVVDDSGDTGISASASSVIENSVRRSGGSGISCGNCVIHRNTILESGLYGIYGDQSTMIGNNIQESASLGILCLSGSPCAYEGNFLDDNSGGNGSAQTQGCLETGGNVCGGDLVCP